MAKELYVFLHGLTVIAQRGHKLEMVLPKVSGHVFKAGNWLGETPIANNAELTLHGVTASATSPGILSLPFIVRLPTAKIEPKPGSVAATFRMPWPKEILGLRMACADPNDPQDYVARTKGSSHKLFRRIATVVVLVYDYKDENVLCLKNHYWQPCSINGAISLHIISTSEEPEGEIHEKETEKVLHKVLHNYPGLEYRMPRPLAAPWMDPQHPYFGDLGATRAARNEYVVSAVPVTPSGAAGAPELAFALAELEYPCTRAFRLECLGRMQRNGGSLQGLWRLPDATSDRTSNCQTIGGH